MDRTKVINRHHKRVATALTAEAQTFTRARTLDMADAFDKRGLAKASCDVIDAAVKKLIADCYAIDQDVGTQVNIDTVTCQILIVVPWGKHHATKGLSATEAIVLRRHMLALSALEFPKPLFIYVEPSRRWFVNPQYNSKSSALQYWQNQKIDAAQYKKAADGMKRK